MPSRPDVVAFVHTYSPDGEFDTYMSALIKAFVDVGVRVHLIRTNDIVANLGSRELSISERKIIKYINQVNPAFIFTSNRGGVTCRMMRETSCPIITYMVDNFPFTHHGKGHDDLFCERDYLISSGSKAVAYFERVYPVLKGRVHFLPFATNVDEFKQRNDLAKQDINISFVGTYFHCGRLTHIFDAYKESPTIVRSLLELAKRVEENYDVVTIVDLEELGLRRVLVDFDLDFYQLKSLLSNAVSLNHRVKYLNAVRELGLRLYGTDNWIQVNAFSLGLLRCFQFGEYIRTRQQLCNVYQRSKIALNISHNQAVGGLPYRVFDIMASKALLLTEYTADSDLFRLFGNDVPVPMFSNEKELRDLVIYYLAHEKERQGLVRECNQLVSKGMGFSDRVTQLFDIAGCRLRETGDGEILRVNASMFYRQRAWIVPEAVVVRSLAWLARYVLKRTTPSEQLFFRRYFRKITTRSIRSKLSGAMASNPIRKNTQRD